MFLASALLDLIPSPNWFAEPDRFFYGGPAAVAWIGVTSVLSAFVGGVIGGRDFPLVALTLHIVIYGVVFGVLRSIAAPIGDPTDTWELIARNAWPFGVALVGTYAGAVGGAQARL